MNGCGYLLGMIALFYFVVLAIYSVYGTTGVIALLVLSFLLSAFND